MTIHSHYYLNEHGEQKKTSSVKISGLECGCGVTWHHKLNSYEIIMPTNSMWGGKNPAICEQWIGSVLYR